MLERFVCESPTRTPRTTSPTAGEMWRASSGRARRFTASSSLSQAMSGESGQILNFDPFFAGFRYEIFYCFRPLINFKFCHIRKFFMTILIFLKP